MGIIRDISCMTVCINLLGNIYYPLHCAATYFAIDFFTVKPDMQLHHLLSLGVIYILFDEQNNPNYKELINLIINTEISTIFLTLTGYCNYFGIMFVPTFFKYRIYDYYMNMDTILSYTEQRPLLIPVIYGLFGLNLYWGALICKKMSKPWLKHKQLSLMGKHIVSHSYFINVGISIYIYQTINWDVFGLMLLSISRYFYYKQHYNLSSYMDIVLNRHVNSISINANLELYYLLNNSCWIVDFIIVYQSSCNICLLEMVFLLYTILLVHYIQPFYDLSFICSQLLYMYKSYLVCKIKQM
jgi:hypothetical protein